MSFSFPVIYSSQKNFAATTGLPWTMLNRVPEFAFCFLSHDRKRTRNPGYRLFFFISDTAKSQARAVSAIYVSDGFTQEEETMHAPSVIKTFITSWA